MDDGRSRKVDVAVAQPEVLAEHGEPAAAPSPVGVDGVNDGADNTLNTANATNLQRSASAPVGIVAAVSMNTIWNRKYAKTGAE